MAQGVDHTSTLISVHDVLNLVVFLQNSGYRRVIVVVKVSISVLDRLFIDSTGLSYVTHTEKGHTIINNSISLVYGLIFGLSQYIRLFVIRFLQKAIFILTLVNRRQQLIFRCFRGNRLIFL